MAKFIFVTGGVVSGLGKGITAASLGRLLKCRGLKVASQKLDPYVNVDPLLFVFSARAAFPVRSETACYQQRRLTTTCESLPCQPL